MHDDLVLPGNRCLLSLNLSSKTFYSIVIFEIQYFYFHYETENQITETGVQHILKAVQYQEMFIKFNISARNPSSTSTPITPSQGLLRLELQVNHSKYI